MTFKRHIRRLVNDPSSSRVAAAFQTTVVVLILVSTAAVIVETIPGVRDSRADLFHGIEVVATLIFTLELTLRFWATSSTSAFIMNGFNIVDLLAILPGYLEIARNALVPSEASHKAGAGAFISLRIIRLLWLVRILRLVKFARHSRLLSICMAVLTKVWRSSIMVILGVLIFQLLLSASLLYLVENDLCEELGVKCSGFDSIPAACWFAASTVTTVGYGDVIPVTVAGKFIAGFFSICAVVTLALAGALLSHDFAEHFREEGERRRLEFLKSVDTRRRLSEDGGGDGTQSMPLPLEEEFCELQGLLKDFKRANERLVAGLSLAANRRQSEDDKKARALHIMTPMLSLIQERSRILIAEVQSVAYQEMLRDEGTIDEAAQFLMPDNRAAAGHMHPTTSWRTQ